MEFGQKGIRFPCRSYYSIPLDEDSVHYKVFYPPRESTRAQEWWSALSEKDLLYGDLLRRALLKVGPMRRIKIAKGTDLDLIAEYKPSLASELRKIGFRSICEPLRGKIGAHLLSSQPKYIPSYCELDNPNFFEEGEKGVEGKEIPNIEILQDNIVNEFADWLSFIKSKSEEELEVLLSKVFDIPLQVEPYLTDARYYLSRLLENAQFLPSGFCFACSNMELLGKKEGKKDPWAFKRECGERCLKDPQIPCFSTFSKLISFLCSSTDGKLKRVRKAGKPWKKEYYITDLKRTAILISLSVLQEYLGRRTSETRKELIKYGKRLWKLNEELKQYRVLVPRELLDLIESLMAFINRYTIGNIQNAKRILTSYDFKLLDLNDVTQKLSKLIGENGLKKYLTDEEKEPSTSLVPSRKIISELEGLRKKVKEKFDSKDLSKYKYDVRMSEERKRVFLDILPVHFLIKGVLDPNAEDIKEAIKELYKTSFKNLNCVYKVKFEQFLRNNGANN